MIDYGNWKPNWLVNAYTGSIYHQRCKDIEKQLSKSSITAKVSRHDFKNTEYYDLEISLKSKNSEQQLADALHIPKDKVHFVHIDLKQDYKIIWIEEDYLHERYLTGNGRLCFDYQDNMKKQVENYLGKDNIEVMEIKDDCGEIIIRMINKDYY